jgi:putative GTP pyrophosphokinase
MAEKISKSQVDRLGDRLKKGNISEDDLRMLDQYRRLYSETYEVVVERIRTELSLAPTGRPAKSTSSIAEKLRRESIRLTQIQDIAGCRIIVENIASQEAVVKSLSELFEDVAIIDRRQQPSHGYRAVHVVVSYQGKLIEVQVRTALQQLWAELSEKLSDIFDPMIKYGGGDELTRTMLTTQSSAIANEELLEMQILPEMRGILDSFRLWWLESLRNTLNNLETLRKE